MTRPRITRPEHIMPLSYDRAVIIRQDCAFVTAMLRAIDNGDECPKRWNTNRPARGIDKRPCTKNPKFIRAGSIPIPTVSVGAEVADMGG